MTAPPRRPIQPGDLLLGEDHDFVVNAYIALLGRWPDEEGYRHYLGMIRNRPERRAEVLRALAASEEARHAAAAVALPEGPILPSDPRRAMAAALALRTEFLQAEIARLREALALLAGPGGPELAGLGAELIEARDAELRAEIAALRRELRARPEAPAGAEPPGEHAVAALTGYVGEMLALAEARLEPRLRAIEARLLALGAAPPRAS
jgi:hypothetical protein